MWGIPYSIPGGWILFWIFVFYLGRALKKYTSETGTNTLNTNLNWNLVHNGSKENILALFYKYILISPEKTGISSSEIFRVISLGHFSAK